MVRSNYGLTTQTTNLSNQWQSSLNCLLIYSPSTFDQISHCNLYSTFLTKFNFILPKVNPDYIRQTQVLNIDNLRLIIYL